MKKHISTLVISLLFLSACYKDKNNYTVAPINEAIITAPSDGYTVEQLGELHISPEVNYTLHNNDNYSYEWKIFEPRERDDYTNRDIYSEVIATTKDLKEIIYAPAGQYSLLYTVTNNNTGISNFKEFQLTVNSGFYEGLVVAYDKDNRAELGFIRKDDEIALDLIQQMNGLSITDNVQQINTLIVRSLRIISLTTANNHYQIDADEFVILKDKSALFNVTINGFGNSALLGNKMPAPYDAPSDLFYINQGKLYADLGPDFAGSMAGQYSQQFYYTHGNYDLYPFLFNGPSGATIYFYDNLNRKLLRAGYNGRELSDVTTAGGSAFDLNTINKTAIGAMAGYGNDVYYIMRDDDGRHYIYVMTQYATAIAKSIINIDPTNAPDFSNSAVFDARTDQRQLYYASNNRLYLYDFDTNSTRLVLTLSGSEQIADILVYRANMWQNSTDDEFGTQIFIATNNGQNGKVYRYGLSTDGSLSASPQKEYPGFGRIVNIDYRNVNE